MVYLSKVAELVEDMKRRDRNGNWQKGTELIVLTLPTAVRNTLYRMARALAKMAGLSHAQARTVLVCATLTVYRPIRRQGKGVV